jgi:hypothetical protein
MTDGIYSRVPRGAVQSLTRVRITSLISLEHEQTAAPLRAMAIGSIAT